MQHLWLLTLLVAEIVQVYAEKKYCSFINLFVLYVSAVARVGLAGTRLAGGGRGAELACGGWDPANRGPVRNCWEDAGMTPNPTCHGGAIACVTYQP